MSALENARRQRSPSPPGSSGRDSPLGRPRRRQVEDDTKKQDKPIRRYALSIERALASFDTGRLEWPDYISFLGRLLKAIQAHPPTVDSIPHKHSISNRLAQCLSPALPSGVHQKAIDVYTYIFSLIGTDVLAQDLNIYLPGLSSVLSFASLSLRPSFLNLIETHVLVLDAQALRPALKALLLSLLPGLEDETSEEFDRILHILDTLKSHIARGTASDLGTKDAYFWQCLFLASISSTSRRQGALAFLTRRLPRLINDESLHADVDSAQDIYLTKSSLAVEAESVVSPEPGLLVRCFATGLRDEQYLLQRGFLDLLLSHLPLDSPVLLHLVNSQDLVRLIGAALGVVLRRDMGLNRRLWSWLLGPDMMKNEEQEYGSSTNNELETIGSTLETSKSAAYFSRFGKKPLIEALLLQIHAEGVESIDRARPFRLCLSLMDRWEIGSQVIQETFLPAMEALFEYKQHAPDHDFEEVLKSASSFFDGVESGVIWGQILKLITSLNSDELDLNSSLRKLQVVEFMIGAFNIKEEEMMTVHAPLVALYILTLLNDPNSTKSSLNDRAYYQVLESLTSLLEKLLRYIPERTNLNASFQITITESDEKEQTNRAVARRSIQEFYFQHNGHLALSPPPLSSSKTGDMLLSESASLLKYVLLLSSTPEAVSICARIFSGFVSKFPDCDFADSGDLVDAMVKLLEARSGIGTEISPISFSCIAAMVQVLRKLGTVKPECFKSVRVRSRRLLTLLIEKIWHFLSPSRPKHHLEAIRSLWQLDSLPIAGFIIETSISSLLQKGNSIKSNDESQVEHLRRFMVLWAHSTVNDRSNNRGQRSPFLRQANFGSDSTNLYELGGYQERLQRPLMLLLDALVDGDAEVRYTISNWLEYLPDVRDIFEILLTKLCNLDLPSFDTASSEESHESQRAHANTSAEYLYYLQHILKLLGLCPERSWTVLQEADEPDHEDAKKSTSKSTVMNLSELCIRIIQAGSTALISYKSNETLQELALSILQIILERSPSINLNILGLEQLLIAELRKNMSGGVCNSSVQIEFLDVLSISLKHRPASIQRKHTTSAHARKSSITTLRNLSKLSMTNASESDLNQADESKAQESETPLELIKCLQEGISSTASTFVLDRWVKFLSEVLPFCATGLFESMIPLVETFCQRIRKTSDDLQASFRESSFRDNAVPEASILSLLSGLETILATAHYHLQADEEFTANVKSPEISQGFFGNVVSGVFTSDIPKARVTATNTRLTFIICLQDALNVAFDVWSWTSPGKEVPLPDSTCATTFAFISKRIRNRLRRILDRMFSAEILECVENVVTRWSSTQNDSASDLIPFPAFNLLQVLDGSRPKVTVPALFNSIYSRTNPSALESNKLSTLTVDIADTDLTYFLIEYTETLDDDAMDEIWSDCITFLRDVLSNPLPHSHIHPYLLTFVVVLAEKLEKTNFGEQRRMRKELSDIFIRLLSATFTIRTATVIKEPSSLTTRDENTTSRISSKSRKAREPDVVQTLTELLPRIQGTLVDDDRIPSVITSISTNMLSPLIHAKTFPSNLSAAHLELLLAVCKCPSASKIWKKDVQDALFSSKFFLTEWHLSQQWWQPILRQWLLSDKDRIPDICSRIAAPASAGIMFGVGANAARVDADKKTQLHLRRIALLILAADVDFAVGSISTLEEKIIELLQASSSSSPSSGTRSELFMLLRALVQRTSFVHLAPLWPLITSELQKAIAASLPDAADYETYNTVSLLQACKLLDVLLTIAPDDFQMLEWLFIADTIDAVYRPLNWEPVGIADEIADELSAATTDTPITPGGGRGGIFGATSGAPGVFGLAHAAAATGRSVGSMTSNSTVTNLALTNLDEQTMALPKNEFVNRVLRPFFSALSIQTYEAMYSLKTPSWEKCHDALLRDLFDESTIAG